MSMDATLRISLSAMQGMSMALIRDQGCSGVAGKCGLQAAHNVRAGCSTHFVMAPITRVRSTEWLRSVYCIFICQITFIVLPLDSTHILVAHQWLTGGFAY